MEVEWGGGGRGSEEGGGGAAGLQYFQKERKIRLLKCSTLSQISAKINSQKKKKKSPTTGDKPDHTISSPRSRRLWWAKIPENLSSGSGFLNYEVSNVRTVTKWSNDLCLHFLLSSVFPHIYGKYCKCSTRYFAVSGIRVLHLIFDTLDDVRGVVEEVLNGESEFRTRKLQQTTSPSLSLSLFFWSFNRRLTVCINNNSDLA